MSPRRLINGPELEDYLRLVGDTDVQLPNDRAHQLAPGADVSRALFLPLINEIRTKIPQGIIVPTDIIYGKRLDSLRHKMPNGASRTHVFPANVSREDIYFYPARNPRDYIARQWQLGTHHAFLGTSLRIIADGDDLDLQTDDWLNFGTVYHEARLITNPQLKPYEFFSHSQGTHLYRTFKPLRGNFVERNSYTYPDLVARWETQEDTPEGDEKMRVLMRKLDPKKRKLYTAEQALYDDKVVVQFKGPEHAHKALTFHYNDRGLIHEIHFTQPQKPLQIHTFKWDFI